ncbi:MAG: 3-oxoacyl-ACP synthase [Candidatus Amoebophilus sp. 36-38]|nr:MAG: 3-oxoacyl-ACP synthase [Candidatus Amoebophilus sp. 36-38]
MKTAIQAAITGVHGYVPDYILTNHELERMVDTNDDWITTRTGIKERHILKDPGQGTSVLGIQAVQGLLQKTNTDPQEIDLLICATITPDMITPATANIITHAVGAVNAFSYDLQAACSGFLYALITGSQFIESGRYKKVIIVGADKMSSIVNYEDRATCILFGDGAGAVLLEPNVQGYGIVDSLLKGDGNGEQYLHLKAGGSRRPPSIETVTAKEHYVYQDGKTVYRFAVEKMAEVVLDLMKKNNLKREELKFLVPHQANKRILDAVAQRIGIPEEQVMITIHEFGNTTDGTIPLCLWRYEPKLKAGDKLIITTFGGGFTWGATYLTWAYGE